MIPNFTDDRGTITDLIVTPDYSVTHITFAPNAIRGNHYHNHTRQIDLVLNGTLTAYQNEVTLFLKTGMRLVHEPTVKHAYKAGKNGAEIISICWGMRKGSDYEKDVIRLSEEEKLI